MELHRLAACPDCGRQFDLPADGSGEGPAPGERFRCSCGGTVGVPTGLAEDAAVVVCSACGGPRHGAAPSCAYCGADFTLRELDLDAVCPRCLARVSRRGRFCHHCALPLTAPREAVPTDYPCPACPAGEDGRRNLVSRRVGEGDPLHLFECPSCAGVWLDREVFAVLVERARQRRPGLPPAREEGPGGVEREWRYRPCPVCSALMNRRNYGRRSGVVLDVCAGHGVWFDPEELARVLEWVRRGGAIPAEAQPAEPVSVPRLGNLGPEGWSGGRGAWGAALPELLADVVLAVAGLFGARR